MTLVWLLVVIVVVAVVVVVVVVIAAVVVDVVVVDSWLCVEVMSWRCDMDVVTMSIFGRSHYLK
jgi:hypothetical protein